MVRAVIECVERLRLDYLGVGRGEATEARRGEARQETTWLGGELGPCVGRGVTHGGGVLRVEGGGWV